MADRVHLSKVVFDAGAARNAGKKLYMCRHQGRSPAATYADIAERHDLDTALQDKYDLRWLTYYVNREAGASFCLAEAPSREAVEACHREAHGNMLPYRVVEVDAAMVDVFLGDLMTPDPGYPWAESPFRTILTSDLANVTDLTVQFGDAAALRALQDFEELVQYACGRGRGCEIQRATSRVIASFSSASRAVESALTILEAVSVYNGKTEKPPLEVRIGLSAGEPLTEDGELFGAAVQLAARVCSTAPPGSIHVTGVVRDLCVGKALEFTDLGAVEVEGFGGVRLYRVNSVRKSTAKPPSAPSPDGLTEREVEVLRLIASGRSNHQIAEALVISANTVARHVANIFNKTGAANRTEAAAYAYRERLA